MLVTSLLDAHVSFRTQRLVTPLRLSSGAIESVTEAVASVAIEINGRRQAGWGVIYLSDLWAWPDSSLKHDERDAALRRCCELIAHELSHAFREQRGHPLELGLRLHDWACHGLSQTPSPSLLARAMCASPFDAAIHDAAGIALGRSAFALYDEPAEIPSADPYFPQVGACRAIADTLTPPRRELPAWFVVSKDDAVASNLAPAVRRHGYRCFKLKLTGRDPRADAQRTAEVYRTAVSCGSLAPRLTGDPNEASPSVESVLEYLEQLRIADAEAFAALEYLEQPTSRYIQAQPCDWQEVAARKPVLLDEGLTDLAMLEEARRQHYSGLALKTCKGHSMLLTAAAWARKHNMLISLQDLTNPGLALIHAALVGAHLPTINGAELNSPQFTPAANADFAARMPELFQPRGGVHRLPQAIPHGLGSTFRSPLNHAAASSGDSVPI
ncbi:MAG: mandelate racemase/muconate lactonizing enzyme family protein [Pirellulales bacterium]|nr:mandelate racemase/muconate lactonizing enzyme family protein [Pirellulales bacterium]